VTKGQGKQAKNVLVHTTLADLARRCMISSLPRETLTFSTAAWEHFDNNLGCGGVKELLVPFRHLT